MAKYDIYTDPRGGESLLLSIQADMFDGFDTRLAIPLLPEHPRRTPLKKLNPTFVIGEKRYVLYTQHMLAVPARALQNRVADAEDRRDDITAAIDFLHQGF
jgi:toxin CcdB